MKGSRVIYEALAEHQQEDGWELQDLFGELHRWARLFNLQFKLQIEQVSLMVDELPRRCLGHFRYGHNGFGLQGEIAINRRYLGREFWEVLGTLFHELLHAWQQSHGKPGRGNYHNVEFCRKAAEFGLIIDRYGHTQYMKPSPFTALLEKHQVRVPDLPVAMVRKKPGGSKLVKWSCGCTNVRVAISDFQAECLKCGNKFFRAD